jgi:hypothetical protein
MIEVEAKEIGFYGNRRRYPKGHAKHETFIVDKVDGSWMQVVKKIDKPTLAELNQGGEQSPPAPQDGASEGGDNESDTTGTDDQGIGALSRKKKDDLVAIAVERGLSENVDLTQLNRNQLIALIQESYEAEQSPPASQDGASEGGQEATQ